MMSLVRGSPAVVTNNGRLALPQWTTAAWAAVWEGSPGDADDVQGLSAHVGGRPGEGAVRQPYGLLLDRVGESSVACHDEGGNGALSRHAFGAVAGSASMSGIGDAA
jgi:hypothetical protein